MKVALFEDFIGHCRTKWAKTQKMKKGGIIILLVRVEPWIATPTVLLLEHEDSGVHRYKLYV